MDLRSQLVSIIRTATCGVDVRGKVGRELQRLIAKDLVDAGFEVDCEDTRFLLWPGIPVWRGLHGEITPTTARRKIDIVVYSNDKLVALIETESDLNDLGKRGTYNVLSIARDASGSPFNSYNSLERMATAAFLAADAGPQGDAIERLERLRTDAPSEHNPLGLPMFLVTGRCRPSDRAALEPRVRSLGAELVSLEPIP